MKRKAILKIEQPSINNYILILKTSWVLWGIFGYVEQERFFSTSSDSILNEINNYKDEYKVIKIINKSFSINNLNG